MPSSVRWLISSRPAAAAALMPNPARHSFKTSARGFERADAAADLADLRIEGSDL